MRWSVPIVKVFNISIELHITFILFFGFLALVGIQTVLFFILLFSVVLAHELVHSMCAIFHGLRVPKITLLPIGGLASIELPQDPEIEIKVAIAGPIFNFVLAGVSLLLLILWDGSFIGVNMIIEKLSEGDIGIDNITQVLSTMIYMNIIIGAFNLLPAFPMDGGRVFRGMLALWIDYVTATKFATVVGQVIFLGLAFLGILNLNLWWVIIGIFLSYAGSSEMKFVSLRNAISDIKIEDVAIKNIPYANQSLRWSQFMDTVYRRGQNIYLLVDIRGSVRKVMDIRDQKPKGNKDSISESLGSSFKVVPGDSLLVDCLKDIMSGEIILVNSQDKLQGYVTEEDLSGVLGAMTLKKRLLGHI